MGKSLKNLHNSNSANQEEETKASVNGALNNTNDNDIRSAEAKVGKYRNMNENQLMNELMSKMNNAKTSGNFDTQELENFYYQMAPHLTHDQRNKMRSLINMMKNS